MCLTAHKQVGTESDANTNANTCVIHGLAISHLKSVPHKHIGTKPDANADVTHQGEVIEHLLDLNFSTYSFLLLMFHINHHWYLFSKLLHCGILVAFRQSCCTLFLPRSVHVEDAEAERFVLFVFQLCFLTWKWFPSSQGSWRMSDSLRHSWVQDHGRSGSPFWVTSLTLSYQGEKQAAPSKDDYLSKGI